MPDNTYLLVLRPNHDETIQPAFVISPAGVKLEYVTEVDIFLRPGKGSTARIRVVGPTPMDAATEITVPVRIEVRQPCGN